MNRLFLLLCIVLFSLSFSFENDLKKNITRAWIINQLKIDGKDSLLSFNFNMIRFYTGDSCELPIRSDFEFAKAKWKIKSIYLKKKLIIYDAKDSVFNGIYNINYDKYEYRIFPKVILKSKRVQFVLG